MKEIIFINSHPIQYFAPLYKYLNENGLKTSAWYGSKGSLEKSFDKEFGIHVKWDIPLLEGYDCIFYKNYSWKPSHATGFFGLMNFGMVASLFKLKKSIIVVHGYHYFTHLLIILLGRFAGHKICFRSETPYNQEHKKNSLPQKMKRFLLRNVLFPRVDKFLFIGTQNKMFYETYGVTKDRLLFCPYSVDNDRFRKEALKLVDEFENFRSELNIPIEAKVILYSGKLIFKKRPLDLLKAFASIENSNYWLVMVGDGEQRSQLEDCILKNKLSNVIITGFINQSEISRYYSISNLFVMCSESGETWGLSTNEAMNFNLPIVISDMTGCAIDLVKNDNVGYIFETGNVTELASCIQKILHSTKHVNSSKVIEEFSYATCAKSLHQIAE